jgi:hypothetical protein
MTGFRPALNTLLAGRAAKGGSRGSKAIPPTAEVRLIEPDQEAFDKVLEEEKVGVLATLLSRAQVPAEWITQTALWEKPGRANPLRGPSEESALALRFGDLPAERPGRECSCSRSITAGISRTGRTPSAHPTRDRERLGRRRGGEIG